MLQEIFNRIQESTRKKRELNMTYKDALQNIKEHRDATDQIKTLRLRKKQIEYTVRQQMSQDYAKIEYLAKDINTDKQLLTDASVNSLVKGEPVKVVGSDNIEYEPLFSVRFKKKI